MNKQKVNWDAMAVIIVVIGALISGIMGYANLQGQTETTAETVNTLEKCVSENVPGTLKNEVEVNKKDIADNKSDIKVLSTKLDAIQKSQTELRDEVRTSNAELKAMMNTILQKLN